MQRRFRLTAFGPSLLRALISKSITYAFTTSAAKGSLNIADDAFVHVTTGQAHKYSFKRVKPRNFRICNKMEICEKMSQTHLSLIQCCIVKNFGLTAGKFDNGFNILQINAKPTFFSPRTNWVNGIPQYKFNTLVPPSKITLIR